MDEVVHQVGSTVEGDMNRAAEPIKTVPGKTMARQMVMRRFLEAGEVQKDGKSAATKGKFRDPLDKITAMKAKAKEMLGR